MLVNHATSNTAEFMTEHHDSIHTFSLTHPFHLLLKWERIVSIKSLSAFCPLWEHSYDPGAITLCDKSETRFLEEAMSTDRTGENNVLDATDVR